jgi:uncharacterized protein YfbU (UPF0304 family)
MTTNLIEERIIDTEDTEMLLAAYLDGADCEPVTESRCVEHDGAKLTMKEVRAIYDDLPERDRRTVKALARKFVELAKCEKSGNLEPYTFDDGLMDVARLGVFICA